MSQSEISLEDDGGSEEEEGEGNHFLGHLSATSSDVNPSCNKAHNESGESSVTLGGEMVHSGVSGALAEEEEEEEGLNIKAVESDSYEDDLEEAFSAL